MSDTQAIFLSSASQRKSGNLLHWPSCLTVNGGTMKSVDALTKRNLVEERETGKAAVVNVDARLEPLVLDITQAEQETDLHHHHQAYYLG